jgi:hypothetical protein
VEEQDAVVCVRRDFWERVTEMEELVGRLRVVSRLPQYLAASQNSLLFHSWLTVALGDLRARQTYFMTAMFTGAVVLAL